MCLHESVVCVRACVCLFVLLVFRLCDRHYKS